MTERSSLTLPACLVIMDGFGLANPGSGNAISLANTPHLDELFVACPHIELDASGKPVGLPEGQMGNSEVGHLNIGAGRTVHQELSRIDNACESGELFELAFREMMPEREICVVTDKKVPISSAGERFLEVLRERKV